MKQSPAHNRQPAPINRIRSRKIAAQLDPQRLAPSAAHPTSQNREPCALTQRARPVTRGRRQDICSRLPQVSAQRTRHRGRSKSKGQDVRTAPRLSLWIRAPRLLRRAARICVSAAPGLRAAAAARRRKADRRAERCACSASATERRPPAREPRKAFEALFLDPGRRTKSEGSCRRFRYVAVGYCG